VADSSSDETFEFSQPRLDAPPSDETIVFEPPPRLRPTYITLVFCVVAAAGFLAGIGFAAGSREAPRKPGRIVIEERVGPSGGVFRFDDGQLEIPEDALAEPVRIVVRRSTFTDRVRVAPAAGTSQVYDAGDLDAYSFEPVSVAFLRPVRIVFRLPSGARNGTIFARTGDAVVLLGGTVDPDRETTTITVRDFRFDEEREP
jgi:hypothetical protein